MRTRLILAALATLALAACSESPAAPQARVPGARSSDDITCKSGYHIATRLDGSQFCEEDGG